MANKFEGDWHYRFLEVDDAGNITLTDMGHFHLPTVEPNGNLKDATDEDQEVLTGEITQTGPYETINLHRAAGPVRHMRGILASEAVPMVLIGQHRMGPFPPGQHPGGGPANLPPGKDDGTWVATKP